MLRPLEFVSAVHAGHIQSIAALARQIWNEHYPGIISQEQIDYMLNRLQSDAAIEQQIRSGDEYFLIRHQGNDAGYLAVRAEPQRQRLFISKLYLLNPLRGQGLARQTMRWLVHNRKETVFWLTVNKHNPALLVYQRLGFRIVSEVVADIGNGFVMDDYQLEWHRSEQDGE